MESTLQAAPTVNALPAGPRWRLRFSLGTLVLACIAVGAVLIVWLSHREVTRLRKEVLELRDRLGVVAVENPGKLCVRAGMNTEPRKWRWFIHVPEGHPQYLTICLGTEIPLSGLQWSSSGSSGTAVNCELNPGQRTVEAVLTSVGNCWRVTVSIDGSHLPRYVQSSLPLLTEESSVQVDQAGVERTESFDQAQSVSILRYRKRKFRPPNMEIVDPDPCSGLMILLVPAGDARL